MNYYIGCFKRYADFSGRARRKEYWMFALFNAIAYSVVGLVDGIFGMNRALSCLYGLAVLIPGLAVTARRLHDTNRSGWWMLIGLVPVVGSIWLLVLLVLDSQLGPNRFGPNPKVS